MLQNQNIVIPTLFGTDVTSGGIQTSGRTYQVTIENHSEVIWEEVSLFYDIIGLEGVIPLIVQGIFPPETGLIFNLCPCDRLNSYAFGVFFRDINGDLLTASFPPEGGAFPANVGSANPCHPIFEIFL